MKLSCQPVGLILVGLFSFCHFHLQKTQIMIPGDDSQQKRTMVLFIVAWGWHWIQNSDVISQHVTSRKLFSSCVQRQSPWRSFCKFFSIARASLRCMGCHCAQFYDHNHAIGKQNTGSLSSLVHGNRKNDFGVLLELCGFRFGKVPL